MGIGGGSPLVGKSSPFLRGQNRSMNYKGGSNASGLRFSGETCQVQVKAGRPTGGNADGLLRGIPAGKRRRGSQVGIPACTEEVAVPADGWMDREQRTCCGQVFPSGAMWAWAGAPAWPRGKAAIAAVSTKPAKNVLIQKGFLRSREKSKHPRYSVVC